MSRRKKDPAEFAGYMTATRTPGGKWDVSEPEWIKETSMGRTPPKPRAKIVKAIATLLDYLPSDALTVRMRELREPAVFLTDARMVNHHDYAGRATEAEVRAAVQAIIDARAKKGDAQTTNASKAYSFKITMPRFKKKAK